MFIFLHTDKHLSLLQVDTIILMSVLRHAQRTKNKFPYLFNLSIKAWGMKMILRLQINITFSNNVFYMIVSHWMRVARHVQSTENNRVTIFLQCLKENMKDEVDFLHADKCRKFFLKWYYHFRCMWPGMSRLPKITSLLFLRIILRRKWMMELIFPCRKAWKLFANLYEHSLIGMMNHSQISQNSKFRMSLQYFKKKS